tara:strand:+ start:8372 stop:9334 length:963 start_codon:yes stop_codon:yes gene_type:complete
MGTLVEITGDSGDYYYTTVNAVEEIYYNGIFTSADDVVSVDAGGNEVDENGIISGELFYSGWVKAYEVTYTDTVSDTGNVDLYVDSYIDYCTYEEGFDYGINEYILDSMNRALWDASYRYGPTDWPYYVGITPGRTKTVYTYTTWYVGDARRLADTSWILPDPEEFSTYEYAAQRVIFVPISTKDGDTVYTWINPTAKIDVDNSFRDSEVYFPVEYEAAAGGDMEFAQQKAQFDLESEAFDLSDDATTAEAFDAWITEEYENLKSLTLAKIGNLARPVFNFQKTKSRPLKPNQLSLFASEDVTETTVSVAATSTTTTETY